VDFVVIGGFSLAAHGYVRGTKDVDVFPAPARANLARLADALRSVDAERMEIDEFPTEELGIELDAEGLALGGNWVLRTRYGRLDVMQDAPGVDDYPTLREGAVAFDVPGLEHTLLFAGRDDLVKMKRATGRDQDLVDIAELERTGGEGGDRS
jgi:hypothetical protein